MCENSEEKIVPALISMQVIGLVATWHHKNDWSKKFTGNILVMVSVMSMEVYIR